MSELTTSAPAAPRTTQRQKSPSRAHRSKDSAQTFTWIEDRLSEIYAGTRNSAQPVELAPKDYLAIYNAVHSFCVATKCLDGRKNSGQVPNAESLYRCLERDAKRYCIETRGVILASACENDKNHSARGLVQEYLAQWSKYARLATLVANSMRFQDRHWIKRTVDEGNIKDVHSIQDLHKIAWKEGVLRVSASETDVANGAGEIVKAVKTLCERVDSGDESDRELLEVVTSSWASLALSMELHSRLLLGAGEGENV